jgi:hypothetical protein
MFHLINNFPGPSAPRDVDCPGPKQLTCRHFIDMAFMILLTMVAYWENREWCKIYETWQLEKMNNSNIKQTIDAYNKNA